MGFFKKPKQDPSKLQQSVEAINLSVLDTEKKLDPKLKEEVSKKRKELLGKDSLSREEIIETIEKYYDIKTNPQNNPYKTREDCYVSFFNYDMSINRDMVPFEEIEIGSKKFILNKTFENGQIKINYLFYLPELEINLETEYNKKEQTKKRLEDINKFILHIENKIAQGYSDYKLIDLKDFKYEKTQLQKILETIKYGKTAIFTMTHPFTKKKVFLLRKHNQSYNWLKFTEHNFVTPEHTSRSTVTSKIVQDVQKILNFRNKKHLEGFFKAIGIFLMICLLGFASFKLITFDEELLDKRVAETVNIRLEPLNEEVKFLRQQLVKNGIKADSNPNIEDLDFNEPR
jgi:low affinity Fe/Cu permease